MEVPLYFARASFPGQGPVFPVLAGPSRVEDVLPLLLALQEAAQGFGDYFVAIDEASEFHEFSSGTLLLHSIEGVAHDGDQHVQQHQRHHNRSQQEYEVLEHRVLLDGEVSKVEEEDVHQVGRVGGGSELVERGGGGEEERDDEVGRADEEEEGNHVLHDFDDDPEQHARALEEREDREGLDAMEEAQEGEKELVQLLVVRHRNCHSEVEEAEDEAQEVEPVPEIGEVEALLLAHFNDLDGQVPGLDEEERDDEDGGEVEGSVDEDEEEPQKEEARLQSEIPARVLPPLLDEDLDKLAVEDGGVVGAGEVLEELEGGGVVARGEAQHTPEYLDLVLLVGAPFFEVLFEAPQVLLVRLKAHLRDRSVGPHSLDFFERLFVEPVEGDLERLGLLVKGLDAVLEDEEEGVVLVTPHLLGDLEDEILPIEGFLKLAEGVGLGQVDKNERVEFKSRHCSLSLAPDLQDLVNVGCGAPGAGFLPRPQSSESGLHVFLLRAALSL